MKFNSYFSDCNQLWYHYTDKVIFLDPIFGKLDSRIIKTELTQSIVIFVNSHIEIINYV